MSDSTPRDTDEMIVDLVVYLEELSMKRPAASFEELLLECPSEHQEQLRSAELQARLKSEFQCVRAVSEVFEFVGTDAPRSPHVPGYQVLELIGQGGVGVVYRARQFSLDRDVALKLMLGGRFVSPRMRERFRREAETAARLQHPHIAQVYDHGEVDDLPYLVQELVRGGTLADRINETSQPPRESARLVETLAEAIHYAHQNDVIHRDLKPSNVLLTQDGQPKIADFGLAKLLDFDSRLTYTDERPGTPSYMAPEQISCGEVGPATDVYALGAILFEMLTGKPPFSGVSLTELYARILNEQPEFGKSPRTLPADLVAIAQKCLEKSASRRYRSAAALAQDLRRWVDGEPTKARPLTAIQKFVNWIRRRPTAAALVFVSLAAAIILLAGSAFYSLHVTRLFQVAELHRRDAESKQETLREFLYAADMPLAYKAHQRNNIEQMHAILARHVPDRGQEDLRGFPWHFLDQISHSERLALRGHEGDVFTVLYSPDGKLLATCGKDKTVRLWNATDGRLLKTLRGHAKEVNCIAFSPDGRTLASAGDEGVVRTWNLAAALTVADSPDSTLPAAIKSGDQKADYSIRTVAFSPDGKTLAAAGEARVVELFSAVESDQRIALPEQSQVITCMLFARDGKSIFAAAGNFVVRFDAATGNEIDKSSSFADKIASMDLSHDGSILMLANGRNEIYTLNPDSFQPLSSWGTQHATIDDIEFSADDQQVAICGKDRTIELWNVATQTRQLTLRGHGGRVWSIAFSPDGKTLASASADGTVKLWNTIATNPRCLIGESTRGHCDAIAFSADSRFLAAGYDSGQIELWDWQTGNRLQAWNGAGGSKEPQPVRGVAFSPTGKQLASSHSDGVARLWDAASGNLESELTGLRRDAGGLSYSPDGNSLAVGVRDMTFCARIWQLPNLQPNSVSWQFVGAATQYLSATPLLMAHSAGAIRLFRTTDLSEQSYLGMPSEHAMCIAISPTGQFCVTGGDSVDRSIRIWEIATGRCLASLVGHEDEVEAVAICPDGRTISSASTDGTLRLWDISTAQELLTIELPVQKGIAMAFSPDGRALAVTKDSSTSDGQICIWSAGVSTVNPQAVLPRAMEPEHGSAQAGSATRLAAATSETVFRRMEMERRWFADQVDFGIRWASSNAKGMALPTFHDRARNGVIEHCVVLLGSYVWHGVFPPLDNVNQIDIRRHQQITNSGAALPDDSVAAFVVGTPAIDLPYKWQLIPLSAEIVDRQAVPAGEIGPTDDLFERFRRVHSWAKKHGYVGGFPTFIDESQNGHITYDLVLIRPGKGQEVWIPVTDVRP